jgi:hypothetical protein
MSMDTHFITRMLLLLTSGGAKSASLDIATNDARRTRKKSTRGKPARVLQTSRRGSYISSVRSRWSLDYPTGRGECFFRV